MFASIIFAFHKYVKYYTSLIAIHRGEVYVGPCETSVIKLLGKIANGFRRWNKLKWFEKI